MDNFSSVGNQEQDAIDDLYQSYLENPESLDESWRHFFSGFELAKKHYPAKPGETVTGNIDKEFAILNLIHGYRQRGHLFTKTNPVRTRRQYSPTLDIENFGLEKSDLERTFQAGNNIGIGRAKLKDIVEHLEATYCHSIGVEYVYMRKPEVVEWLKKRMESTRNSQNFTSEEKKHIFYHLKLAVGFESFIHKKFVGQKRFSLEGAESLIPALDAVIERGAELGIDEFVIGMSHRGRLNVLANILEKPYENIFKEFYGKKYEDDILQGDVKYHLGYENEVMTDFGKKVKLKLMPNPSHLEAVGPIVQGMVRSRIDSVYKKDFDKAAGIVIHGDAAIAAQGVVYETIQMSQLNGYKTGGTIHLVINNQVGFTTPYLDARSSTYCTDVAKVTRSPVFHVNGDDVESLIFTIKLAMEFRQKFNSDVFIDILCYRKYGHNEGDEPRFTQPMLYKAITSHPNPRDIYSGKLNELDVITKEESRKEIREFDKFLDEKYSDSEKIEKLKIRKFLIREYESYEMPQNAMFDQTVNTRVKKDLLIEIGEKINTLPGDLTFFKKVNRIVSDRKMMIHDDNLDWAMGELLAYGTLLNEGHPVRISGQDSERGTFAHRHASFVVEGTDEKYFPLKHVSKEQAPFHIFNSLLSEFAVMGFEYGYALAQPNGLTIWEAQFGDFSNEAQVVIDQYITSAFEKWGLMNNLVLFLPHGYEGQGPEHSSARMERFLELAANNNIQVVVPTTPANVFHLLRRQVKMKMRLPLVVFTPKSLLRHPQAVSKVEDLANGTFQEVIDDSTAHPEKVERVVFTTGRLYYDLLKYKMEKGISDTAIVRVEQVYPIPNKQINEILKRYNTADLIWAQDEPENMGAWPMINRKLHCLGFKLVARPENASPAAGLMEIHRQSLDDILEAIFQKEKVVAP
ncbi:2-oxoglutarate dehydrogenase E1 component [Tangfeifania diversioriginum]|uniref:oxoglutarate dehydrogenase (succinyl-transferring) n=1 Tax=Tangfeifania diversioriginum TaxID=1168035 RepID=A0A1M6GYH1_9BACT|nr:2-oxoglutarate dehydrogenase E1 component [Tangfeifania diversioriginum]SHJ14966.1 2-oxoglutarate dehydrogenase E1 component [Tangfeifania diversioriginum]